MKVAITITLTQNQSIIIFMKILQFIFGTCIFNMQKI